LVTESLGAPAGVSLVPGLGAASWGPGRLDVFARSSTNVVWQRWFDGGWRPWADLGFTASSPVAATSWASGRLDLFFRDPATSRLRHRYYQNGWNDGGLVGTSTIQAGALTAAAWEPGRIDIFQRGANSELRHIWYANGWASDWVTEAGTSGDVASAPSAVAWGPGRLDVFWRSAANNSLQHWWYDNGLHPLDPLGGELLASAPTAASRGTGLLDVFYLSGSNINTLARRMYNRAWLGESFDLAGAKEPAVASWGPGRLDLFYQDSSNALQHTIVPGPPVLTHHNDNARTGANLHEVELNVDNVASAKFGRLFSINVDGNVYAQPLYVPTLDLRAQGFGIVNVVYIATANNSIYMADADNGAILKRLAFNNPVPVPFADFTAGSQGGFCLYNLIPQVGITSTPVIDLARKTMYVVSVRADTSLSAESIPVACPPLRNPSNVRYRVLLHALDITTLAERSGSPVEVSGTAGGFTFDARRQLQRPALLLSNGAVYLAFGSYTDTTPYTGWVISYDALTLARRHLFVTTPNGTMGGIWQSGQGLAGDSAGSIYFLTGNGSSNPSQNQFGTAAVKLSSTLTLQSYFMPWNHAFMNGTDMDLGSSGIMLVPGTNYALGGGKESILYMMDRTNLGGMNLNADQVVYEDQVTFGNPAARSTRTFTARRCTGNRPPGRASTSSGKKISCGRTRSMRRRSLRSRARRRRAPAAACRAGFSRSPRPAASAGRVWFGATRRSRIRSRPWFPAASTRSTRRISRSCGRPTSA
jgi:hypothetical protein